MTDDQTKRDETASALTIRLLGSADLWRSGQLVRGFRSAKAQALLYYLAARGRPVMRTTLIGLFWADQAEEQARTNLNQALSNLRKVMGDAIDITRQTAALVPEQVQSLDVRDLAEAARRAQSLDTEALLQAAALYRGEFLEGFAVRDAAEFEVWLQSERERMREAAVTLLVEAARRSEQAGDSARAEGALRSLLRIEPWRESAHRQLMLLLARRGARDAALAQYAACRQALAAALDVEPETETEELYAAIRSGKIGPEPQQSPPGFAGLAGNAAASHPISASRITPSPVHPLTHSPIPPHNLPAQTTPFVGRARELAEVLQCLADPGCRLLTVIGPGGVGKSRLAQQAALHALQDETLAAQFADGICFVALAAVDTAGGVLAAIAAATGLQFYDQLPAHQQVIAFLAPKRMLLVLDNLEQLVSSTDAGLLAQWLNELWAAADHVKLLATSREGLGLQEAWFYPLAGLSLPLSATTEAALPPTSWPASDSSSLADLDFAAGEPSDAVQLFVQCARRARVGFSLSTTHDAVARICRMVDGVPLAIELAAAWLKALTAEQVAAELERSLDILTTQHQNVPARHRSMRAVCESSWQLLPAALRRVMGRLAWHRGGFRLQAAREIAGASLFDLMALVEKSLLRQAEDGRYVMHELLRQYALERLAEQGETGAVRRRHAQYYLDFLQGRHVALTGPAQRQALEELAEEQENLHAAWQSAVAEGMFDLLDGACLALCEFLQVRSRYWEGHELFTLAASSLAADPSSPAHPLTRSALGVRLRARQGAFVFYLGQYREAVPLVEESLAQARLLDLPADEAFALNLLGQIAGWQGERERARTYLQESLRLCRQLGDQAGIANTLHKLAQVYGSVGDYAAARRLAQESHALCVELGRPDWIGYALDALGWMTLCLGDYWACWDHYSAGLRLFQEIGDRLGAALALGGLGSVEWARGGERLLSAAAYMTESLNLCQAIGHRHHAASRLWYLGQIAVEQGDYPLARSYAEEGKALAEAVGSRVFVAYNLCALAAAERGLGHATQAWAHLLAVLRIAGEVQHLPPLLIALIELARLTLADEVGAAQRQLAGASLAAVIAHPACWQPFRVRAQQLAAELAEPPAAPLAPLPAGSVEELAAAWQALEEPTA